MHRRWLLRLVPQEGEPALHLMDDWKNLALVRIQQPGVTLELVCNGEVVLAFHSPHLRNEVGEVYTIKVVDNRYPLEVFYEDLETFGIADTGAARA